MTHGGKLEQVVFAVALSQRLALLILAVAVVVVEVVVSRVVAPARLALLLRVGRVSSAHRAVSSERWAARRVPPLARPLPALLLTCLGRAITLAPCFACKYALLMTAVRLRTALRRLSVDSLPYASHGPLKSYFSWM